ncbi:pseudouridine synthase [Anaerosalibacter sp. Marseille-P3206]|uniref:pseudouridine synthase n=1 Tax=Anaerosalibacter sp. Marseille-P3206 TaxID=1871005 RepID=UPI0009849F45|nr:pseudouridine synthase [Anaerosalibacter sp. Marseille-P3206]
MGKKERVDKILSNLGYGSRKEIKSFVKQGMISVGNELIKDSSIKVDPTVEEIYFEGEKVYYREFIYLMLNKPQDVVSSTNDPISKTVLDLIDSKYLAFNPHPAGRLDKDTEGLLLITNDGKLSHELLSPKKNVKKTYYVEVDGYVDEKYFEVFESGIVLDDGYKTKPAKLEIIESGYVSKVYLTISEGKYHQVKRMFESLEMNVLYLKRISMGSLVLDDSLQPGEYRELSDEEVLLLKKS